MQQRQQTDKQEKGGEDASERTIGRAFDLVRAAKFFVHD
jgi:hypothetical protein